VPRSQTRQKNSQLLSILSSAAAPFDPGDTCTILMPNTTLFIVFSHIRLLPEEYRKSTERSTLYIFGERHKALSKPGSMLLDSIEMSSKRNGNKGD